MSLPKNSLKILDSDYLKLVTLILLSALVFFRSLSIYFVGDNLDHIDSAWQSLTDLSFHYFRPLSIFTLIIDKLFWGYNFTGYHLTNLILHTTNTLLVYVLAKHFFSTRSIAFVSALLFLLHPIHSSSIYWISGRADMICTGFYLAGLIFFISYKNSESKRAMLYSLACYQFALLSKEMAVSFPLVISAFVMIFGFDRGQRIRDAIRMTWPFWVLTAVYLTFRFATAGTNILTGNVHTNIDPFILLKNTAVFLELLVIPGGHIEIGNFLNSNPVVFLVLSIIVIVVLLLFAKLFAKQKNLLLFSFFVLLAILPVIRLTMRWYLYLPSVGFCLGLGYLFWKLKNLNGHYKKIAYFLLAVIVLTYSSFLIIEQNRWLKSGLISRQVSYQIAEKIAEENIDKFMLLSVPAEYKETPVLIHGLEPIVNFRLRSEFDYSKLVEIMSLTQVSIHGEYEPAFVTISVIDSISSNLSLSGTNSFFIFPEQQDLISQKAVIKVGTKISYVTHELTVLELNDAGQAIRLNCIIKDLTWQVFELKSNILMALKLPKIE